jgi:ribosomal protein S18 acetylase RimI-like enzyme
MVSEIDIHAGSAALEIYLLAQAAYHLEAARIGCADFPPLRETLAQLRTSGDRFLVYRSEKIQGVLSFDSSVPGQVVITRLVVSPKSLRQGVATALLRALGGQANGKASITATTAEANLPAILLYERMGFQRLDVRQSPEGISLVQFGSRAIF